MKKNYLAVAIAAMIFTGCSNVELEDPNVVPDKAYLGFRSVVTADLVTRAADADAPLNAAFKFNLAAVGDFAAIDGQEVTYAGNAYTLTTDVVIFANAPRTLTAWSPATVNPKQDEINIFNLTPGVVGTATDFVYQKNLTVNSTDAPALELTMEHAFAKLIFEVEFPEGHVTPKQISGLTVVGTPDVSDFDITTGTWTANTTKKDIVVVNAAQETSVEMAALVVPTTDVVDLKVTCTINGKQYSNIAITGITALAKATKYTVTLKVSGDKVVISGVTVGGWAEGDNGSAELK